MRADGILRVTETLRERLKQALLNSGIPGATVFVGPLDDADASGAIGSAYGLYVNTFGRTGTITNAWGVYVKDATLDNYFSGRVGFGTTTFGTSAAGGVLGIANASVVPASSPADMIQLYAKDSSAGAANSTVAVRTEQGVEAIGTFTASHKLRVWINEVEYHIQLDAV